MIDTMSPVAFAKDFLSILDLTPVDLDRLLAAAAQMKAERRVGRQSPAALSGLHVALLFEKPSLRTRSTFEIAIRELGGDTLHLPAQFAEGVREPLVDIARNLERWVDFIMARTNSHATLVDLATHARVPVINGLSDLRHPCQVLSDCFTLLERHGRLEGLRVAWLGDGNNVANSWIAVAPRFGFAFALACPAGYEPDPVTVKKARAEGATIEIGADPRAALRGADVIYTDVWTSMGQEAEATQRRRDFLDYQVNAAALRQAKPDAVVMHCLPAHRGEEITGEVIDGPQSIVFDQAENRLHVQKGVLVWLNQQIGRH